VHRPERVHTLMLFRFYTVYKFIRNTNATVEYVAIVMHCNLNLRPPNAAPFVLRFDYSVNQFLSDL